MARTGLRKCVLSKIWDYCWCDVAERRWGGAADRRLIVNQDQLIRISCRVTDESACMGQQHPGLSKTETAP